MDTVNWLFFDLNSYFASVEQQEIPSLRNRPVAVVPVMAETTCCIAASYEAKAYGIQTGTIVREAKKLCPGLLLVEARQDLYVIYHQKVRAAVDSCIPVSAVLSIDEMICRLQGSQCEIPKAIELAKKLKAVLKKEVGEYVRCSVGLAPNRYLAKVASDMQKPDGLTVIYKSQLPQSLFSLKLRSLPGIGERMEERLHKEGLFTIEQLAQLSQKEMHRAWGSIEGDRFYAWLRGEDTPEAPHHRYSIGHSHVLEPQARTKGAMLEVAKNLVAKAARRLRKEEFWASGLTLVIQYDRDDIWESKARFFEAQDTARLLKVLADLWEDVPDRKPLSVSVAFHPLVPRQLHIPSFFENPNCEKIAAVMDAINDKLGKDTLYPASLQASRGKAPTRISFSRIPDPSEF